LRYQGANGRGTAQISPVPRRNPRRTRSSRGSGTPPSSQARNVGHVCEPCAEGNCVSVTPVWGFGGRVVRHPVSGTSSRLNRPASMRGTAIRFTYLDYRQGSTSLYEITPVGFLSLGCMYPATEASHIMASAARDRKLVQRTCLAPRPVEVCGEIRRHPPLLSTFHQRKYLDDNESNNSP
jgi:hypothetical protein